MKVFCGGSNPALANKICKYLKINIGEATCKRFSDGEIYVKLNENVRGRDVFIIQSTQPPADNLMELLFLIDAAKRASAQRVTAVIPYFGYSRQDKKDEPRVPISAKLVANLITAAGADRVLTLDLHAEQIQGFFDIPVDNIYGMPVIAESFKQISSKNTVVIAPDTGGTKRARGFARRFGDLPIAIIDKRRPSPNQAFVMNIVGEVRGKDCLIVDDMVDTAGTLVGGANAISNAGADKVYAWCTHPLLSGNAVEKIENSKIEKMFVSDTVPIKNSSKKIHILTVANLLGEAISRIHEEKSVSSLFIE